MHVWVGYDGVKRYLEQGTKGQWDAFIGGYRVPHASQIVPNHSFVHSTDAITSFAHSQVLLTFCIDVAGYGLLALIVAWLILNRASWTAYFIGVFVIGLADLTFLFAILVPGVIEATLGTVGGPILWLLAIILIPFGMPSLVKN